MKLEGYFSPKSIAIVGISSNEQKVGSLVARNLLAQGYPGEVYFVNPKYEELLGKKVYPSLTAIGKPIDLAVLAVPAEASVSLLEELNALGIRHAVLFAAGFKEIGQEGVDLEQTLLRRADEYGITFLGPNCIGFINTRAKVNTTFLKHVAPEGNIGFISQSGALGSLIQDYFVNHYFLGFSVFASLGNKSQIDESDVLAYLGNDEQTKVIGMYLEDVRNGEKFMQTLSAVTRKKPVIILKSGSTNEGSAAAVSHTGSMIGDDAVFSAAFKQCGAIRVEQFEEFMALLRIFSYERTPLSREVMILSNAGGAGVLLTDELVKRGCNLVTISEETKREIQNAMGAHRVTLHNPIDLLGDASAFHYRQTIASTMKEQNIGSVIILLTPQANTEVEETARIIAQAQDQFKTPFYPIFMGERSVGKSHVFFEQKRIASFSTYDYLPKALDKITTCVTIREAIDKANPRKLTEQQIRTISPLISDAKGKGRTFLNTYDSIQIMETLGIPFVPTVLLKTEMEAKKHVEHASFPVVMKIYSQTITHKTDVQAVYVGVSTADEYLETYRRIMQIPGADGVLVQHMAKGLELIIGAKRDPIFGEIVMVGMGGVTAELMEQPLLVVSPVGKTTLEAMLRERRWTQIFNAFRGFGTISPETLHTYLESIGALMREYKEVREIDCNPVFITADGLLGVDARVVLG